MTSVYDNFSLLPSNECIRSYCSEFGYSPEQCEEFLISWKEVPRSRWLDSLVEEYFLRRILRRESASSLVFFEKELMREILSLVLGSSKQTSDAGAKKSNEAPPLPPQLVKAVEYIEARLFSLIDLAEIAKEASLSLSSLNRVFQAHLKKTPGEYLRVRRLEEAASVLRGTQITVEETATLVGYDDASAFTRAFRAQYKMTPKQYRESVE